VPVKPGRTIRQDSSKKRVPGPSGPGSGPPWLRRGQGKASAACGRPRVGSERARTPTGFPQRSGSRSGESGTAGQKLGQGLVREFDADGPVTG
jgi:hypothetical protein